MLIGREREMAVLERLYSQRGFQFSVLFGRRRVGKTYLMSEFARERPCIFFTAVEESASANLLNLSREIYAFDHPDADPTVAPVYPNFQAAFEAVFERARSQRLVFVVDEYPYLAAADASVASTLQLLIDRNKDDSQLFLMLCGSSLTFMREKVLGAKSPLYGRRTAQIELRPLDFFDARRFFPDAPVEDAVAYYGIAGGVPLYLAQFDPSLPVGENVARALLAPDAFLYEEPLNLMRQEVTKAGTYNEVMSAIANGKTTNGEIAAEVGVKTSDLTYYLRELQSLGLVEKRAPIVGSGRRAVYRLCDNLFAFWYRFVCPYRPTIERGMPQRALHAVEGHLTEYLGPVFERVCADWLWRKNVADELAVSFDDLGSWWGNNPVEKREEEVDLVAVADGRPALVGECKWRSESTGENVDKTLLARMPLFRADASAERYVFSKGAFTEGMLERERSDERLHLVLASEL